MAELRLIAAALALASGCRASEAGPTSGLTPPSGWQPLPELVTAATDAAKAAAITVDGVEAWGDPARGCYGAWLALRGDAGAPDVLGARLVESVTAAPALAGITVRDVVKPASGAEAGVMSLAFARGPHHGKLRAKIGKTGAYSVLACFWNAREPIACETACNQLIGSMQ